MAGWNEIRKAKRLFDRGDVNEAAWLLWEVWREADEDRDTYRLKQVEEAAAEMRERLQGDDRLQAFEEHLRGHGVPGTTVDAAHRIVDTHEPVDVTPVSLAIALVGAALMLLAIFLPQFESNTFSQIEKNSLIQNGDGWWFIGLAVGSTGAAYRAYQQQRRTFAPVVLGGIAIAAALYYGVSHSARRLCSVADTMSDCTLATPGVGIYAAGVGGLLVVIGGWQIFRSDPTGPHDDIVEQPRPADDGHPTTSVSAPTIAERLRTLEQLRADDLITDEEYARRRAALIDEV